jgi:adenylate cyclase
MGDGLLAIFPFDAGAASNGSARAVGDVCDAALDAASESLSALKVLNAARSSRGEPEIHFGLAMHVGDVTYGNIGGSGRLDFTCIGPAVNLAARIEGLNSKLGRTMLLSEDFARLTTRSVEAVGAFELKGMTGPQNMFAPA